MKTTHTLIQSLQQAFTAKLVNGDFELSEVKNKQSVTVTVDKDYPFRFFLNPHGKNVTSLDKSRNLVKIEPSEEDSHKIYEQINDELERRELERLKEKFENK